MSEVLRLKRFSSIFSLLLMFSVFVGVVYELNHTHYDDATCEACLFVHTPGLIDIAHPVIAITAHYEPILSAHMLSVVPIKITLRSRAPPLV